MNWVLIYFWLALYIKRCCFVLTLLNKYHAMKSLRFRPDIPNLYWYFRVETGSLQFGQIFHMKAQNHQGMYFAASEAKAYRILGLIRRPVVSIKKKHWSDLTWSIAVKFGVNIITQKERKRWEESNNNDRRFQNIVIMNRLQKCQFSKLEKSRWRGDLTEAYKLMTNKEVILYSEECCLTLSTAAKLFFATSATKGVVTTPLDSVFGLKYCIVWYSDWFSIFFWIKWYI